MTKSTLTTQKKEAKENKMKTPIVQMRPILTTSMTTELMAGLRILMIITMMIALGLLASCGSLDSTLSSASRTPNSHLSSGIGSNQSIGIGPIKIGWIGPLTGTGAPYGVPALNAAKLAIEDVNAAGGINGQNVELAVEDGKCEGGAATTAANKLLDVDGVKYILGGHCSTESLSILPITESKGAFLLAGATGTNKFTGAGTHAFRTFPSAKNIFSKLAEFAHGKGISTVVTFSEEKDWPQSVVESFANRFTELGGTVIGKETYAPGTSDFRTQLLKIRQHKPDAVMISVQGPDSAAQIIKQMRELDINLQIYGDSLVVSKATYDKTQGLLPSIAVGGSPHVNIEREPTKTFYIRYKERFGEPGVDPFIAAEGYDGARILVELIKACGQDVECARNEILSREFTGVTGLFSFGEDGDSKQAYTGIVRIVDGKQVFEYEGK